MYIYYVYVYIEREIRERGMQNKYGKWPPHGSLIWLSVCSVYIVGVTTLIMPYYDPFYIW